jgi:peptidoglycan/LPS O-acetylase OafA/YrhL
MILGVVYSELQESGRRLDPRGQVALIVAALLVALPALVLSYGGLGRISAYAYQTLVAVAAALFLALVVIPSSGVGPGRGWRRILESRWIVRLGLISYSLFLWHEPIVHTLRERGLTLAGPQGLAVNLMLVGSVAIALSIVTYRFVELPALRRKKPPGERSARADSLRSGEKAAT